MRLSDIRAAKGSSVPVGTITDSPFDAIPDGYLLCDGSAVSRATYARLFNKIGTTYGVGDGSTTFALPDYRGYVRRGIAGDTNNDPDKGDRTDRGDGTTGNHVGTKQGHDTAEHKHNIVAHQHRYDIDGGGGMLNFGGSAKEAQYNNISGGEWLAQTSGVITNAALPDSETLNYGGSETRMINVYVKPIIKY